MQSDRAVVSVKGISLYPEQDAVIAQFAKESGLGYSAAIRFIIQDWVKLKRSAIQAAAPTNHDHTEEETLVPA